MHQSQLALEFTVNFTPLSFAPLSSSPNSTSTTAALLAAAFSSNHHSASSNTTKQYQNQPFNPHNQTNMPNTTFLNALRHDAESSLGFAPSSSPTKERSDSISSLHVISDSEDSDVSSSSANLEKLVRSIPRKPRLIRSRSASSPFWFGTEDSDHIRNIWQRYTDHFKIALNRPKNSRRPVEFIGCIRRTQLTPLSSTSDAPFQTLDEITVFQRDILPLGCPLPKQEVLYSVVTWDNEDGLPTNFGDKLTSAKYQRRLEQLSEHPVSYFYCLPIFNLDHEYVFFNELTPRHQVSFFAPASPEMSLASDLRSVAKNSLSGGDGDDMSPWTPPKSAPTLGTLSGSSVTAACLALPISLSGSESMCMFPMDFDSPQVGGSGGGPRFSAMVFTTSSSGSGVNDDDDADNCGFMFSSSGDDDAEVDLEEIPDDEEEEEEEQADDDDDVDYQHEAEDEYEAEATGFDFSGPPASSSFSRSSSISITIQKRPASGAVEKDQQQKMSRSFEEDLANLMSSVGGGGARGGAKKSTLFTATFQFFDE